MCVGKIVNTRLHSLFRRKAVETKILETKAMTTSSHCNTGRNYYPLSITTREHSSLSIHVVQKIAIIPAQKIGKFAV